MRILVTTDNHVGYIEHDAVRGEDSARTFDEVLKIAAESEVDFIIQGGDLFHINKPSKRSLYQVIRSLREHCLGDKPIEFELLHHGSLSVDGEFDYANFEDPNLNIAIPVFAISGNHDDRGGAVLLSPLDTLAATGLINYFGRVLDNDSIEVTPLIMQKGDTKIAIYGLSNVRDERLHRTFRSGGVKFKVLPDQSSYFNILVVHQNRAAHSATNYLPPEFLPSFFDIVIWGHEHECRIDPEKTTQNFEILQPGSSVATSLCEGEAVQKSVGILDISSKSYKLTKVPLTSVRPFKMRTVNLAQDSKIKAERGASDKVVAWMVSQIEELIAEADEEWQRLNPDADTKPLPLIRLRVDYSGYEVENPTRFSNRFIGKVANTNDVVQYMKKRQEKQKSAESVGIEFDPIEPETKVQLKDLVSQFLETQKLTVLPEKSMALAISQFVDQDDKAAIKALVDSEVQKSVQSLTGAEAETRSSIRSLPIITKQAVTQAAAEVDTDSEFAVESDEDMEDTAVSRAILNATRASKAATTTSAAPSRPADPQSIAPKAKAKPARAPVPRAPKAASKAAPKRTEIIELSDSEPEAPKKAASKRAKPAAKPAPSRRKTAVSAPIVLDGIMDSDDGFD